MNTESPKIVAVMPRHKIIFKNVEQARFLLAQDGLGCVYRTADKVYVVTAYGSGEFTSAEWDRE